MKTTIVSMMMSTVVASAGGVLPAFAQQPAIASESVRISARSATEQVLKRLVTIRVDRVPFREALAAVGSSAGVAIQYRRTALEGVEGFVTLHAEQMPLGIALDRILAGTILQAVPFDARTVTIQRTTASMPAQDGVIVGRVLHAQTKQPVGGATITLDGEKRIAVGDDGSFRLVANSGEHTIQVRGLGFTRYTTRVTVVDGQTVTLEVTLAPTTSVLDEVIVTGSVIATERKAIPTPITVITAEDIERRGITRIDEFFRGEVPGVVALERGAEAYLSESLGAMSSSQVYARGSSTLTGAPNPMKTYIDGVELLDPSYLGTIDPTTIERIEIVTGPQAATIYGSGAMGGVMQIFTKKGNGRSAPDLSIALKYGMLETNIANGLTPSHAHTLSLSGGTGSVFFYTGTLSYNYTGQWQPKLFSRRYGGSIGATYTMGFMTVRGSAGWTAGKNGTILDTFRQLLVPSRGSQFFMPGNIQLAPTQRVSSSATQTLTLNADHRIRAGWQHSVALGRNQNTFAIKPERPRFQSPSDTLYQYRNSYGQRTTLGYNTTITTPTWAGVAQTLTFGLNGSYGDQISNGGCGATARSTTWVPCTGRIYASELAGLTVSQDLSSSRWGGFGQWRAGLFDHFFLTLGVRGERSPSYGASHKVDWTPTNGASLSFGAGNVTVKFLGSYGRATREPGNNLRGELLSNVSNYLQWTPNPFLQQVENRELRPERSRGPQGGMEIYYGNWLSLSVNHYSQKTTDLIERVQVDSVLLFNLSDPSRTLWTQVYQNMNVADIRQYGWEGTMSLNWGPWSAQGTYSWTESRVLRSLRIGPGTSFMYPTHTGNLSVGYAMNATSVSVVTSFIGAQATSRSWLYYDLECRECMYSRSNMNFQAALAPWRRPGYAKTDLSVRQRIGKGMSATMNVTNLGNSFANDKDPGVITVGRQTLLGLSIKYP